MWLSSISKRTPQAYFIYFLLGIFLLLVPVLNGAFERGEFPSFSPGQTPYILSPLLILFVSFLCIRIYVISDVFSRNTLWPGQTYLLLAITVGLNASLSEVVIHGLAGILIVNELVNVSYNRGARMHAFSIALCIGIASFFNSTLICLAPFVLLGLRSLKPLNLKEYIIFLLGLATPYYFLWAYSFLSGDYAHLAGLSRLDNWFQYADGTKWSEWLRWALALLIAVTTLAAALVRYNSLAVHERRLSMAIFYLYAGCALALIIGGNQPELIFYLAPAFAFPATLMMLIYSKKPYLELIHIIFVGIIVAGILAGSI